MRNTMRSKLIGVALVAALVSLAAQPLLAGHYRYRRHHGYYGYAGHYGYASHYGYPYIGARGSYSYHLYQQQAERDALRELAVAGLGGLDLNVKPKQAQIYVNGRQVGQAKAFDGRPGYLWLKEGSHEVIFYRDGYETVVAEFTIQRGVLSEVKLRMTEGKGIEPSKLTSRSARSDAQKGS